MSKLSFISSKDRGYNISRVLSLIKTDITTGLKNANRIVIKPHCAFPDYQFGSTHTDALASVLDFIFPHTNSQIILAEGSPNKKTLDLFKNYGYLDIQEKYDLALVDLKNDEYENIEFIDNKGKFYLESFPKTILEADYFISLAIPQTYHDLLYSGAIANIMPSYLYYKSQATSMIKNFGFSKNNISSEISVKATNDNIYKLFKTRPISLAIIDGYNIIHGNNYHKEGEHIPTYWAIASTDAPGADYLSSQLLGLNANNIPYIKNILNDLDEEESIVVGDDWKSKVIKIKKPDYPS